MFPLLSLRTEVIFWLLAIGLSILTVVKWNKISGKKFRNIFARFSVLILIQVIFVSALGLTINRAGEFYSSWNDLLGIRADLSKSAVSTSALSGITSHDLRKGKSLAGGSLVIKRIITGENSGVTDTVFVVLPPKIAKEMRSNSDFTKIKEDYRVAELFSGYPGVPATWIGALKGITTLEELENSHLIPQTIAIIPSINVAPHEDTECMNYRGGPQVETWLTKDIQLFAQRYIGIDNRPWFTFGYSTGGWCAAEIAIRHQDQFTSAISLAGYFSPAYAFGSTKVERDYLKNEYDLLRILKGGNNSVKLLVIASKNDRFSYGSTQSFIKAAISLLSIKYDEIPSGGHNLSVWRPYVKTGFLWAEGV
jgi:pimeloyl-ACP methyl ester carboxylesterase